MVSAAGWATKTHLVQGQGSVLRKSLHETVTLESVHNAWSNVSDMSKAVQCTENAQLLSNLMTVVEELKAADSGVSEYSSDFAFGAKDLILYALGSK